MVGELDLADPRLLDRLVDGELTDEQERAVIAQLESTPDGWRRCALAFLEARCWQRASSHWQQCAPGTDPGVALPDAQGDQRQARARRLRGWTARWPGALALCAVFLLAFAIGSMLPPGGPRRGLPLANPNADQARQADQTLAQTTPAASADSTLHSGAPEPIDSDDLLLGNLSLVDSAGRQYRLPVYDWNQQVANQLMYPSQPLSPEIVQHLKRHQVRSHQSYVPVKLEDGREVVFPVQEVDIVPVGGTAY